MPDRRPTNGAIADELNQIAAGETAPGALFTQIPGIGEELAQRLVEDLGVATFEELEQAAHNGRLQQLEGFSPKRVRNIRVSLAGMLR